MNEPFQVPQTYQEAALIVIVKCDRVKGAKDCGGDRGEDEKTEQEDGEHDGGVELEKAIM